MPRGKRKASEPCVVLTSESSRDEVEVWLQAALPKDLAAQLIEEWRSRGELFDGETLLNADEELLVETGASRMVARRILQKVTEACAAGPARQAAEPDLPGEEGIAHEAPADASEPLQSSAVDDHAVPMVHPLPMRGRGRSVGTAQPVAEEQHEAEQPDAAADDGEADGALQMEQPQGPRMLTRWQRARAAKAAAKRSERGLENTNPNGGAGGPAQGGNAKAGARRSRISSIVVLEQPSQPEQAPANERAARAQAEQAGAAVEEREGEGPLVTEDLGPEMRPGQYVMEWESRTRLGLEEILRDFMGVEQLRELCEHIAEEWHGWESAADCLGEHRRVDGHRSWVPYKQTGPIVKKFMRLVFTGVLEGRVSNGNGPMNRSGIDSMLRIWCCEEAVRQFVHTRLRLRYQNLPHVENPHDLVWQCWRVPAGPNRRVESVLLGSRKLKYKQVSAALEVGRDGTVPWHDFFGGMKRGEMVVDEECASWLRVAHCFQQANRCWIVVQMLGGAPSARTARISLHATWPVNQPGSNLINCAFTEYALSHTHGMEECFGSVDVASLLCSCDEHRDTPLVDQLQRLDAAANATASQVASRGLDEILPVANPLGKGQFDRVIKPLIEALDRPEPEGFKQRCAAAFKLELSAYQRRTVAHMLREETAPGGSARHLWAQLNLPKHPEICAFVSPALSQIRLCTSKIEADHWMHSCGGVGLLGLEVGMGKTLCAIAAIQLNPPEAGWRSNRSFQSHRADDHLSAAVNNMPRGNTLVVTPTAIVNQWSDEVPKSTTARLSICKWVDGSKKEPLCHNAKELSRYDVVLTDITTLRNAANLHTIKSIFWHRVVVDEVQLQGAFLQSAADRSHPLRFRHGWGLSGTLDNDNNLDSMAPQWAFLKLAPHAPILTHFPPVLTHVLKGSIVFYSKSGTLDGRVNLQLPRIEERVLECELTAEDAKWYSLTEADLRLRFNDLLMLSWASLYGIATGLPPKAEERLRRNMPKLRHLVTILRQAASCSYKHPTGREVYDPAKGKHVQETYSFESKVKAVLDVLDKKGPNEKLVVFSEFKPLLQEVKRRLPQLGKNFECRDFLGNAKAETRGQAITDFQMAPPTQIFLITHRTGGAGVTLTSGTHVVLCEPVLNPTFEEQAIGRCNRLGQQSRVTLTRLVMKGTVEEKVVKFMEECAGGPAGGANEIADTGDRSSKLTAHDVHRMLFGEK